MDVRMVQIPSDTGQHGAFEQLHGFASGQQFADTLCDRVARFHGTAFRAWLAFLTTTRTPAPRWQESYFAATRPP
jgi:putative DNA primase/helicase